MILHHKKQRKILPPAEKTEVKIIALRNTLRTVTSKAAVSRILMPPRTQFNMGYLKEKERDPL